MTVADPAGVSALTKERLRASGLRPTRQRLALARILFGRGNRHLTAEALHAEALSANVRVSLATVYNTLHQFVRVGLLREVLIDPGRSYFDTNTVDHHHFYLTETGTLEDIATARVALARLPEPPAGTTIERIDVVIRVRERT
ncbi:MAG: transcriptional repressor [Alphaproteobacteria bacterium]|nr:transcriptional repressor [Alphaproteobacteria bacterium]